MLWRMTDAWNASIKILIRRCLNYSYSDEGLTFETSVPYTKDDDHKYFNLELSKLPLLWRRTNILNISSLHYLRWWS